MSKWYSFKELKRARTPMLLDSVTGLPDNHVITVVERVISVDDSELIQNNVRTDTFTLNLDAEYDDLNVVVIFTKPNNINVKVAYNGTPTHIPGSAMELVGSLACSVVGIDADGEVRAVTKAAPDTFQVVKSGAYDGSVTSDDAELLGQILQAVSDAETAITEAETATTAATNATSQATSAATSANQAASSANSAASSANSAATKANSAAVDAQNAYETLQPYMATIDSCANILHREVGPDSVVTADDAFPAKPVEMVVYGNTVQNLWVNPSGTKNGVTVTANADGSITLSGTATAPTNIFTHAYNLKPRGTYCLTASSIPSGVSFSSRAYDSNGSAIAFTNATTDGKEFVANANAVSYGCVVSVNNGTTVSGTYRVMLNEGSTAEPWCPPGLNSVGQLREDEKNLWVNPSGTADGVTATSNDDGTITLSGTNSQQGTVFIRSSNYILDVEKGETFTLSCGDLTSDHGANFGFLAVGYNDQDVQTPSDRHLAFVNGTKPSTSFTIPSGTTKIQARVVVHAGVTVSGTYKVMLNKGSTPQPWVPPESESCVQVVTAGKNLADYGESENDGWSEYDLNPTTSPVFANMFSKPIACLHEGDAAWLRIEWQDVESTENTVFTFMASEYTNTQLSTVSGGGYSIRTSEGHAVVQIRCIRDYSIVSSGIGLRAFIACNPGSSKSGRIRYAIYLSESDANAGFENYVGTSTPVDLDGHTLNSLPDGTRDELHIDGGNVVLEKRVGVATAPTDAGSWSYDGDIERASFTLPSEGPTSQPDETSWLLCDKLPVRDGTPTGETSYAIVDNKIGYAKNPAITSATTAVTVAGGATYIYKLAEPQTIDLGTITPPTMAAPNVTAYVADDTPAEMELDYVRDINIVVDRLEKKVADLVVTEATIV